MSELEVYTHAVPVGLRGWGLQERDLHSLDLALQSVMLAVRTSLDASPVISAAKMCSVNATEK